MEAKFLTVLSKDDLSDDYVTLNSPKFVSLETVTKETILYS